MVRVDARVSVLGSSSSLHSSADDGDVAGTIWLQATPLVRKRKKDEGRE